MRHLPIGTPAKKQNEFRRDPQEPPQDSGDRRPSKYGKRRAAVLASVYALMAAHIVHWKLAGKTMAPVELNEVMYTLELGIITAGFLFMALAFLSASIFGRFFCSWGCHILALEDLCAWLLRKIRIRPRLIRSRFLLLVPPGVMFYMFLWPQVKRLIVAAWPAATSFFGELPVFNLRVATDAEGWASFVTSDFWRNLPGPGMTILTFLVCGFVMVYLLGSRSFCTYVCPYGVVFGLADRLAPGRIRLTGECVQCGTCTAGCQSNVRVHEEIAKFGKVVSPDCLKDLDCIGGCPQQALSFGFGRRPRSGSDRLRRRLGPAPRAALLVRSSDPPIAGARVSARRDQHSTSSLSATSTLRKYDFSIAEEFGLVVVFVVTLIIFTGLPHSITPWAGRLYGVMPLFLSVGLAVVTAFILLDLWGIAGARIPRNSEFGIRNSEFRTPHSAFRNRIVFPILTSAWLLFVAHSGVVQYHMFQAGLAISKTQSAGPAAMRQVGARHAVPLQRHAAPLYHLEQEVREAVRDGERHLRQAATWGLWPDTRISRQRAWFALVQADSAAAERHLRQAAALEPNHPDSFHQLGRVLAVRGEFAEAARVFGKAEELSRPGGLFASASKKGAVQLVRLGLPEHAVGVLEQAILLRPQDLGLREYLGSILAESGRSEAAIEVLRQILELRPEHHAARVELAELLLNTGSTSQGLIELSRVLQDQPDSAPANALLGRTLLWVSGSPREAIPHLEKAVEWSDGDPNIRSDLAQAYLRIGELDKAESQIRENLKHPETEAGSLYMLGELRRDQGRNAEALEFFRRAHALNPRFPAPTE